MTVSAVEFSDSLLTSISSTPSSKWVSGLEAGFSSPVTAPLWLASRSMSASMDCCFKDLVMLRLALPLLLISPSGVRLLPVFVGDAGRFPLAFRAGLGLGMGNTGVF